MMQQKQVGGGERAVSPVIGVILMVAITVILAAVIGTMVTDMANSAGKSAPQVSIETGINPANDNVTLTHNGGDTLHSTETRVIVTVAGTERTIGPSANKSTLGVGSSATFDFATPAGPSGSWNAYTLNQTVDIKSGDTVVVKLVDTKSKTVFYETETTA